jgi:GNAT superfamily N-acetyltransferase
MGKKSKDPNKSKSNGGASSMTVPPQADYPSDGPSTEEVNSFQTSSTSLQAKLDQLVRLGSSNDRAGFVSQFVPLDLSPEDSRAYLDDLTVHPEAQGQWTNLYAEIAAIASGIGVNKIEGDQQTRAVFFFEHPLLPGCDREVSFVRSNNGELEWRAEG